MSDASDYDDEMMPDPNEIMQGLGFDTRTQLFLSLREQNINLLEIAARVAGLTGEKGPMKPDEVHKAMRTLWDVYSEFYTWVDPEETEEDDE